MLSCVCSLVVTPPRSCGQEAFGACSTARWEVFASGPPALRTARNPSGTAGLLSVMEIVRKWRTELGLMWPTMKPPFFKWISANRVTSGTGTELKLFAVQNWIRFCASKIWTFLVSIWLLLVCFLNAVYVVFLGTVSMKQDGEKIV